MLPLHAESADRWIGGGTGIPLSGSYLPKRSRKGSPKTSPEVKRPDCRTAGLRTATASFVLQSGGFWVAPLFEFRRVQGTGDSGAGPRAQALDWFAPAGCSGTRIRLLRIGGGAGFPIVPANRLTRGGMFWRAFGIRHEQLLHP